MPLITCEGVSFAYEGKQVLNNLNFQVNKGDYLCIVGENGAGKSTLVKGILGLKEPESGRIAFEEGLKPTEVGYLPQQADTQRDFPGGVFEIVLSGRLNSRGIKPFYSRTDKEIAMENLRALGIEDLKKKCYAELSGGQQQRVLLARALCATSKLLLLDEPVTGLDPKMTSDFYSLVRELNEHGITIIMVSHDLAGALTNADHIIHLGKSSHFFGTLDEYRESSLGKEFLGREV
ncbi:zinc transport system ATP-binding protein [Peptostreptococcaceae bacterium pGA-8]|nr:zinc transport system ATP-binding protein [Peptostreptococcaceae bacterium pGA-8]